MKKFLLIMVFFLVSCLSFAQENKIYEYYDKDMKPTATASLVQFYSILEKSSDSLQNNLITFYKNGKIRRYQRFSDYKAGILEGTSEEFFENRNLMSQRYFNNGREQGNSVRFYENGNVKAEEFYRNGNLAESKYFDFDGNSIPNLPVSAKAEFPGGMHKFYSHIQKSINMRKIPRKISGKMIVTFTVMTDGSLADIKILRNLGSSELDFQVVEALKKCPKWIPETKEGEKVTTVMSLPINIEN